MNFSSISEFLAMGGHGLYVWLSYAVALIVLVLNGLVPALRRKAILREQAQRLRREEGLG